MNSNNFSRALLISAALTLLLGFAALGLSAQTKSINFDHDSLKYILAKAKKENKLIFVDAYTTWCGPCKWMANNIFTNDEVADFYNANFICAKIDMEKGEGLAFAKRYQVLCYPNLLFIDKDGHLVHRGAGTKVAKDFIEFGQTALNGDKNFMHFKKQYYLNPNDGNAVMNYLGVLSNTCLYNHADSVLGAYFAKLNDDQLISAENWRLIKEYSHDYKGREFNLVVRRMKDFEKFVAAAALREWIENTYLSQTLVILRTQGINTDSTLLAFRKSIGTGPLSFRNEVVTLVDLQVLSRKKDWTGYEQLALEKVGKGKDVTSAKEINNIAWRLNDHTTKDSTRAIAAQWVKAITEETKDEAELWMYLDTYAVILNKQGNKAEAKVYAAKAIELAKKVGETEDNYASSTAILKE